METAKNFRRTRSARDLCVSLSLLIVGSVLIALPTTISINILGFFMIFAGILLTIFMKTGYKDNETGLRYNKEEIFFDKSHLSRLAQRIPAKICVSDIKDKDHGNGIRLDIYYNKSVGKSYVQLFKYVPYKYEPYTEMYEYTYDNVSEIVK